MIYLNTQPITYSIQFFIGAAMTVRIQNNYRGVVSLKAVKEYAKAVAKEYEEKTGQRIIVTSFFDEQAQLVQKETDAHFIPGMIYVSRWDEKGFADFIGTDPNQLQEIYATPLKTRNRMLNELLYESAHKEILWKAEEESRAMQLKKKREMSNPQSIIE